MFPKIWLSLGVILGWVAMSLDPGSASAAIFADFSAARHDRFVVGAPADPDPLNPNFLFDHSRITGVALTQGVLITPQHFLTATHVSTPNATFVTADGIRHTYAANSRTVLQTTLSSDLTLGNGDVLPAGSVHWSDLSLVRLASPISAADGIDPQPLFGGPSSAIVGRDVDMFVQSNQAGSDTADDVLTVQLNTGAITESVMYRYDNPPGLPASDELRFSGGDSGRASTININGQMAVVGIHMGIGTDDETGDFYSFDSFVLPYLDQIQTLTARDGYQINVVAVPEPRLSWLLAGAVLLATGSPRFFRRSWIAAGIASRRSVSYRTA